ncbi:UTP--glucose-1-phosphate uridylyltransferase [Entamoeba marina]
MDDHQQDNINEQEEETSLTIIVNNDNGTEYKNVEISNIDYTITKIKNIKKALHKFHSQHPQEKHISIRRSDDITSQTLNDEIYLSQIEDFQQLYATISTPFDWITWFQNGYIRYLQKYVLFVNKYFFNYTIFGLFLLWWLLGNSPFKKVFFGAMFFLHYLFLKEVIPLQFTFNVDTDSKYKPIITFLLSLYPLWDIYNPQHNRIIENRENSEESTSGEDSVDEEEEELDVEYQNDQDIDEPVSVDIFDASLKFTHFFYGHSTNQKKDTQLSLDNLLSQNPSTDDVNNLKSFQILHNAFLDTHKDGDAGIQWDKVEALPMENAISYGTLKTNHSKEQTIDLLKKTCIVKINGGLGTSMGCTGPKSVITVRNDMTFLDIIVKQLKALTNEYGVVVPLVLMNSFSTQEDTEKVLAKYKDDKDVKILTFLQHKFPRIDGETFIPVPQKLDGPKQHWYPPGHGDFLQSFVDSRAFATLKEEGREYLFLSNVDNLGATPNIDIMHHFASNQLEFALELTPKTLSDVKGGTLIRYGDKLKMLEIAQVPTDHIEEFQDIKKFKVFNTNNIWMNMNSIEDVVRKETLLNNMDIIVNRKMDGDRKVIQLEIAVGCAVSAFKKTAAFIVPRTRFLPVKSCNDLFVIQSDLYELNDKGEMVKRSQQDIEIPPKITFGKEFQFVADYQMRVKQLPNISQLKSLNVVGDVLFGDDVKLVGDVTITNSTSSPVTIEKQVIDSASINF